MDIVSRLPVNSVMRFRQVHKSWCALFSDPSFISKHFKQTSTTSVEHLIIETASSGRRRNLLYSGAILGDQYQQTLFKDMSVNFKVEDCSNGLICLRHLKPTAGAADIYFWNPAIRKVKILPNYVRCPQDRLGFGFLPRLNDYKVVKMVYSACFQETLSNNNRFAPDVEVFSFSSNSWRRVRKVIPCLTFDEVWTFVNEAVHWRVVSITAGTGILAFDMANEAFQMIKIPSCYKQPFFNFEPKRLGESLSLVVDIGEYWYVWIMKEYGVATSWSNQFKVKRTPQISIIPTDFIRSSEFLCRSSVEKFKNSLYQVNLDGKGYRSFSFEGDFSDWNAYLCAENLILLDGGDDIAQLSDLFGRRKWRWG